MSIYAKNRSRLANLTSRLLLICFFLYSVLNDLAENKYLNNDADKNIKSDKR